MIIACIVPFVGTGIKILIAKYTDVSDVIIVPFVGTGIKIGSILN